MNVLITGGAGRLGRLITEELAEHGHRVTLFDRAAPAEQLDPWETSLPFVKGELTSFDDCARAIQTAQAEAICHVGGIVQPSDHAEIVARRQTQGLPVFAEDETFRVNMMGTYYILDAARRQGVMKVVFASTEFVLGIGYRISSRPWRLEYLPIDERHPCEPEDSYSLSKLLNEEMLAAYARAWGIRTVAFRLLPVFYHFRPENFDRIFQGRASVPAALRHSLVSWCWMYLDGRDAATAFRLAIEASDLEPREVYFLASGRTIGESPAEALRREFPQYAHLAATLGPDDNLISIAAVKQRFRYEPRHQRYGQ